MKTNKKLTTIIVEDLTIRISTGKYGEYMYKSPMYGYKQAFKYNKMVYIYLTDHLDTGYFDRLLFKNRTNKYITNYIIKYRETSKLYNKAILKIKQ